MKLSPKSLTTVAKVIAGDEVSPLYRSGPMLVELFNEFGSHDEYSWSGGFPTRWVYAKDKLSEANDSIRLREIICAALHPKEFVDHGGNSDVIDYLNKHLAFDGFELVSDNRAIWVRDLDGTVVDFEPPPEAKAGANAQFIDEQIIKCERKIGDGDFDGAITNARSMLEAVLVQLEQDLSSTTIPKYDGDLPRLYKRVQKLLNLAPGRPDIDGSLKQVLSGLFNIVQGLSSLRNKMSDSHAASYRPDKHHARLAVNAAKMLSDFLFATRAYQERRSKDLPAN